MPRLLKTVDEDEELFIFCDDGKVTKLHQHTIRLDKLLDTIHNHGGCCLDTEDDILQFLSGCIEDAERVDSSD